MASQMAVYLYDKSDEYVSNEKRSVGIDVFLILANDAFLALWYLYEHSTTNQRTTNSHQQCRHAVNTAYEHSQRYEHNSHENARR